MKTAPLFISILLIAFTSNEVEADAEARLYTPKPGSSVRKEICDSMRKYARQMYRVNPRLKFLWKIDTLKVLGNYAVFEAHAVNPNGSYLQDDSALGDTAQMTFLRRNKDGWWVISDLTRGDVPSAQELRHIRGTFPAEIPSALIPQFWRSKLR